MARSRAISRDRWVIVIVNVFQMMNEPTNKAIPAKIMNITVTTFRSVFTASADSFTTVAPVTASVPSGSTLLILCARSAGATPGSALTLIVSNRPGAPSTCCAVAESKYAPVVPPRFFSPPKPTVPTTVNSWVGPRNSTLIVEPSAMWCSSALVASIATWCAPEGAVPVSSLTSPRSAGSAGRL
jgi:hypothetical protein